MNVARMPQALIEKDTFGLFDDFFHFVTGDDWTSLVADTGSVVSVGDAVGGRLNLATDNTDNDEVAAKTTAEVFLIAAGKPVFGEGRIQFTQPSGNTQNVLFGFMSALAADSLVDNGAGVRTTGNYAVIYCVDGGGVWRCRSRNGTETTDSVSTKTAGGSAFQTLRIEIMDFDASNVEIAYLVDGEYLKDSNDKVITHRLAIASSTEMNFGVYSKTGSADATSVLVDYLAAYQLR